MFKLCHRALELAYFNCALSPYSFLFLLSTSTFYLFLLSHLLFTRHQQENIDRRVDAKNEGEYFTTTVYQMDIERVRYSLSRYLRSRVLKIEKCLEFINSHMDVFDRLSDEEKVFASKLNTLNNSYFEDVVATRLVAEAREYYESSDDRVKNAEPSFQDFVFCKSLVDIKNLQIADQNQDIGEGTIIIVQYAAVRNHVLEGEVILL